MCVCVCVCVIQLEAIVTVAQTSTAILLVLSIYKFPKLRKIIYLEEEMNDVIVKHCTSGSRFNDV